MDIRFADQQSDFVPLGADTSGREAHWEGPIKHIVRPLLDMIISSNKKLIVGVASGEKSCQDYYPINCDDGVESYDTCKVGLIGCNKETNLYVLRWNRNTRARI